MKSSLLTNERLTQAMNILYRYQTLEQMECTKLLQGFICFQVTYDVVLYSVIRNMYINNNVLVYHTDVVH